MLESVNASHFKLSRKNLAILGITLSATAVPAIAAMVGVPDLAIATGGVKWACAGGALLFCIGVMTADPLAATMGLIVGSQNC